MPKNIKETEEEIRKLIREWAEFEREGEKNHRWTSYVPKRNEKRTFEESILDTLARLLTGDETCVAILMKSDGFLLVASNETEPQYAKDYMKSLINYLNSLSQIDKEKNYINLLNYSLLNIYREISEENPEDILEEQGELANFKRYLYGLIDHKFSLNKKEWEKIKELSISAFKEVKDNGKNSLESWDKYLSLLHDIHVIINFFESCEDTKCLKKMIKENKIQYWKIANSENNKMHAEMKILTMLFWEQVLLKEKGYIGISKLCCVPCQLMINIVNDDQGKRFTTCGTHGGTYHKWEVPKLSEKYTADLLWYLKRLKTKARESTSEIPEELYSTAIEIISISK